MATRLNTIADPIEQEYNPGTDGDEGEVDINAWRKDVYDPKDPTMDPGSPKWKPKEYFAKQPKDVIVVNRTASDFLDDPSGQKKVMFTTSINGYKLEFEKGKPTRVPRDFASQLITLKAANSVSEAAVPGI